MAELSDDRRPHGLRGLHYRVYDWVLHWSGHPRAEQALLLLAFAESSFFPVPPDVLLLSMTVARPGRALRYAALCTIGSVAGGLAGYAIGYGAWHAIEPLAFRYLGFLHFTPETFALVQQKYADNAFLAVFTAGFTPIPYKVFTIAGGVFEISVPVFLVASVLGRGGRFFLVAGVVRWLGPAVQPFLERYLGWLTLAFCALLALGFWWLGS
jgi:membrane protein YqaA with SNARE-associated domain